MNLIWEKHKARPNHIACRLVKGDVCASYEYKFGGASK